MDELFEILLGSSRDNTRVALVIDDIASEYLRILDISIPADLAIVCSLDSALGNRAVQLTSFDPEVMIFITTIPLREAAPLITHSVRVTNCPRVHVLTTTSMEAAASNEGVDMEEPYHFLVKDLKPSKAIVNYFPMHAVQISNDVNILSSVDARCFFSLTLNRLGAWAPVLNTSEGARKVLQHDENFNDMQIVIEEVEIEQIPQVLRTQMRCIAHQLAGALVFSIGVDASASIFALGKSADAIGHTLQPLLEPLMEQYEEATGFGLYDERPSMSSRGSIDAKLLALALKLSRGGEEGQPGLGSGGNTAPGNKLTQASLVLVDRLQDLFTPAVVDEVKDCTPEGVDNDLSRSLLATPPYYAKNSSITDSSNFLCDKPSANHHARFHVPFHVLSARQKALFQLLAIPNAGLNEVIPFLVSFLEEPCEVDSVSASSQQGMEHTSKDPCRGPGCLLSTLLLVALTLHLVGLDNNEEGIGTEQLSSLPMLTGAMVEYVIWKAPEEELVTLEEQGLLGPHAFARKSIGAVRGHLNPNAEGSGILGEGMLRLEVQQALEGAVSCLVELAYRSSLLIGVKSSHSQKGDEEDEEAFSFARSALTQLQGQADARSRMVTVASVSTRDHHMRSKEGSFRQESKAQQVSGLLSTLCEALLGNNYHTKDQKQNSSSVLSTLDYVESPLDKLKRAGLGLLSQGFGAFGFGNGGSKNKTPSPKDRPVIVIFVAGGICRREIEQVKMQINTATKAAREGHLATSVSRIVLISNRLLYAPELASGLFSTTML